MRVFKVRPSRSTILGLLFSLAGCGVLVATILAIEGFSETTLIGVILLCSGVAVMARPVFERR